MKHACAQSFVNQTVHPYRGPGKAAVMYGVGVSAEGSTCAAQQISVGLLSSLARQGQEIGLAPQQ